MSPLDLFAPLLAVAAAEVPPSRGINDTVLAPAEKTKTAGPARVCLLQTSIDIEAGETAYLEYLGFHWGGVRVVGKSGEYLVREGDSWAGRRESRRCCPTGGGARSSVPAPATSLNIGSMAA